ncbi:hypothetical protein BV20DRAFT_1037555 [Pilatotrama ljubarskyi]|nr:hypothetical protein BV20DRAFT_1037555 [Pilatotrama ljubarskyi]
MSTDPYHAVQQEVQASLQNAATLRASYMRIRSTAREESEELIWARNEASLAVVESTGARLFGLEDSEVIERRRYVSHVRREIESMRAEVDGPENRRSRPSSMVGSSNRAVDSSTVPEGEDSQAEWAKQEQQMIIRQQDETMDSIAGTLNTLHEQAGLMGQEIGEHIEMLDDLERGVDRSDAKLNTAMKKMRNFIRQTEETKSGWCIVILIIILMALLLAVLLV